MLQSLYGSESLLLLWWGSGSVSGSGSGWQSLGRGCTTILILRNRRRRQVQIQFLTITYQYFVVCLTHDVITRNYMYKTMITVTVFKKDWTYWLVTALTTVRGRGDRRPVRVGIYIILLLPDHGHCCQVAEFGAAKSKIALKWSWQRWHFQLAQIGIISYKIMQEL